ncbi:hypothetical protein ACFE04_009456 [Oxalis oulophora]
MGRDVLPRQLPSAYTTSFSFMLVDELPSWFIRLADPYVKGHLGPYKVRTQNIKKGRLHLAITVLLEDRPDSVQADDKTLDGQTVYKVDKLNPTLDETAKKDSVSPKCSENSKKVSDKFEPISIEGQQETGVGVHQPGSETTQIWEPRKGKGRRLDTQILRASPNDSFNSVSIGADENIEGAIKSVRKGLRRITTVFQKGSGKEDPFNFEEHSGNDFRSPYANIKAVNRKKDIGVNLVVEETKEGSSSLEGSSPESHGKAHMRDIAKNIYKRAEKGARGLKYALSRKDSKRRLADQPLVTELYVPVVSNSSDDKSETSMEAQTPNITILGLEKKDGKMSSPANELVLSPNPKLPEKDVVVEKREFVVDS